MKTAKLATVVGGVLIAFNVSSAQAAITQYSSKAAFEAALLPGYYTEPQMVSAYPNYTGGGGFSYTATAEGGPFGVNGGEDLSTNNSGPSTIDFTFASGIKAFGGYFYNNDTVGDFTTGVFTLTVNSLTSSLIQGGTSSSTTDFYGFISDDALVSASVSVTSGDFATAGTVIVGTVSSAPASVPGPLPLLGGAAAFSWSRRLRRRLLSGRTGA